MTPLRAVMLAEDEDGSSAFGSTWKGDLAAVFLLIAIGAAFAFAMIHVANRTERLENACVASGGHSTAGRIDYVECIP